MKKGKIILLSVLCVIILIIWFNCNPFQDQTKNSVSDLDILDQTAVVKASDNWPLTGSLGVHDPSIIQSGSWYIFGTGVGIQVKRSSDGLAWSDIGRVFSSYPSWANTYVPNHESNIWAPDIKNYNGQFYLYYSISSFGSNTSAIGLAVSSSLTGGWSDKGMVIRSTSSNSYNCIDPHLVIDNSGNAWLAFGSWWNGIHIVQLDKSTMKPRSGASIINIAKRSGGIECPSIVYRNGYYYLFVSIDKCCDGANSTYKIAYGRSSSITGPYVDKNGTRMLDGGCSIFDAGNDYWRGPGGQSLSGTSVIAHHAYRSTDGAAMLLIKNLYWDSAGWPYHN